MATTVYFFMYSYGLFRTNKIWLLKLSGAIILVEKLNQIWTPKKPRCHFLNLADDKMESFREQNQRFVSGRTQSLFAQESRLDPGAQRTEYDSV